MFLLKRCALDGKRVRRNKFGRTYSLSFRYLARLMILVTPKLTQLRSAYSTLANKRGEVREALSIYTSIQDAEAMRSKIESGGEQQKDSSLSEGDLSASVADGSGASSRDSPQGMALSGSGEGVLRS